MDYNSIANELMDQEIMKEGWSAPTLSIWLRDACKCVYCGQDMLKSRAIAYHGYCLDHLLPKRKYAELAQADWNTVLACRQCNGVKARWDPNTEGGETIYSRGKALSVQDSQRIELIERCRRYITDRRAELETIFSGQKQLIHRVLPPI